MQVLVKASIESVGNFDHERLVAFMEIDNVIVFIEQPTKGSGEIIAAELSDFAYVLCYEVFDTLDGNPIDLNGLGKKLSCSIYLA